MTELKGKIWKDPDSSWWLVEVPFLHVMTQGRTQKEALKMIKDAVLELLKDSYQELLGRQFRLRINLHGAGAFSVDASNDKPLLALGLKRKDARHVI